MERASAVYEGLFTDLSDPVCRPWLDRLPTQLDSAFDSGRHGDWPRWQAILRSLPEPGSPTVDFAADTVTIGGCRRPDSDLIDTLLRGLHPWRKGPYDIHGVRIDTEWRSDFKWKRFEAHIRPLAGRTVLDVGCGNGYFAWRMRGGGAKLVVGVDPTLLSVAQFLAVRHLAGAHPVYVVPAGIEDVPANLRAFDTVFSMGVLYHRRSPLDHLLELKGCLRPGGELVLETLVIDGDAGRVLVPEDRYARMRNIWFIPSCLTLELWLKRCGFRAARLVDVTRTTSAEQRSTDWMRFESLIDSLDPADPERTVEGLPAPKRAVFIAESP